MGFNKLDITKGGINFTDISVGQEKQLCLSPKRDEWDIHAHSNMPHNFTFE